MFAGALRTNRQKRKHHSFSSAFGAEPAIPTALDSLAVGLACGDQRRLTKSGSALEALRDDALHKSTYFTFTFFLPTPNCVKNR